MFLFAAKLEEPKLAYEVKGAYKILLQSGRDTPTIVIPANSVNDKKTLGTNLP